MGKTEELASEAFAILEPLGQDQGIKALGLIRARFNNPGTPTEDWRIERAQRGFVGAGKKTEALRTEMAAKRSNSKKR